MKSQLISSIVVTAIIWACIANVLQMLHCPQLTQGEIFLRSHKNFILDFETYCAVKSFGPKVQGAEVFQNEGEIIITGHPGNDSSHVCEEMGCSRFHHVLYRLKHQNDEEKE